MPTERMCSGRHNGLDWSILLTFTELQSQMRVDSIELVNPHSLPIRIQVWDDNGVQVYSTLHTSGHTETFNNFRVRKRDISEIGGQEFAGALRRYIDWNYRVSTEVSS